MVLIAPIIATELGGKQAQMSNLLTCLGLLGFTLSLIFTLLYRKFKRDERDEKKHRESELLIN